MNTYGICINIIFIFFKKGIGKNYEAHITELAHLSPKWDQAKEKDPVLFLKPTTTYAFPGEPLVLPRSPPFVGEVHHEVELGILIGEVVSEPKCAYFRINKYTIHDCAMDMPCWDGLSRKIYPPPPPSFFFFILIYRPKMQTVMMKKSCQRLLDTASPST